MAVVIPNASDTTGGNKYAALDQAEPDALDFELLGVAGNGVVIGCEVSSNNSATNVAVSGGVVLVKGVPYVVPATPVLGIPSAPADNRFDLVVARVTAGVLGLTVVSGENSGLNPSFPKSTSVVVGSPSPSTHINFDTDTVLAALYRSGATAITSSRIVDKRRTVTASIVDQGAIPPFTGYGNGPGSLYYKTGAPNGTASGVYVKTSDGSWIELAQNVGAHTPIGAAMLWPSKEPVPSGCAEANGQGMSTTAYPALFAVYGYTHGGSGGTFLMPNYNNQFIRGTTNVSAVGTTVGANSVTLTNDHLPLHVHSMTHGHTATSPPHDHNANMGSLANPQFNSPFALGVVSTNSYIAPGGVGGHIGIASVTVNVQNFTGNTGPAGTASASTTSIPTVPASTYARWIVRVSLGSDPSFTGGTPDTATQEFNVRTTSFTLELTDAESMISVGSAGNMTITVPNLDFPVGTKIDFWLDGVATITFIPGSGALIKSEDNLLHIAVPYTAASLVKLQTAGQWGLIGKLS